VLSLWYGQRTRACTLLMRAPVVSVKPMVIELYDDRQRVILEGHQLLGDELMEFVKSEGFDSTQDFYDFFIQTYDQHLPVLNPYLIEWKPEVPRG
jgi:hypothetical protein